MERVSEELSGKLSAWEDEELIVGVSFSLSAGWLVVGAEGKTEAGVLASETGVCSVEAAGAATDVCVLFPDAGKSCANTVDAATESSNRVDAEMAKIFLAAIELRNRFIGWNTSNTCTYILVCTV